LERGRSKLEISRCKTLNLRLTNFEYEKISRLAEKLKISKTAAILRGISSYATGEKLNWSTDLTGINIFSGDDFIFNSSSGNLTIQNVCDKVVDFSYNGTTIAYLAKASG